MSEIGTDEILKYNSSVLHNSVCNLPEGSSCIIYEVCCRFRLRPEHCGECWLLRSALSRGLISPNLRSLLIVMDKARLVVTAHAWQAYSRHATALCLKAAASEVLSPEEAEDLRNGEFRRSVQLLCEHDLGYLVSGHFIDALEVVPMYFGD